MVKRPNILFIFSDQQHWQALDFIDSSFQTPNLRRFAAEGITFTQAFCTTPQCSPSRSSMLTGLYPTKTGVLGNMGSAGGDPLAIPTLAPTLQQAGYRTAYFGKWHLGKDPVGTAGWDTDLGVTGAEMYDDLAVTDNGEAFLQQAAQGDQPFALFLSYLNPHDIYSFRRERSPAPRQPVPLPPSWSQKDLETVPSVQQQFMLEDHGKVIVHSEEPAWQRYRELYREKVALYDQEMGMVLEALDRSSLRDSTVVVVTSDHGDMDTNQRLVFKGPFMYDHMVRIPLMVRLPAGVGLPPGTRLDNPTVNVDLAPTLADIAGTALAQTDGYSLKPLLWGEPAPAPRDYVVAQYYSKQTWVNPIRMVRTADYKYTCYQGHGEELYHLTSDPLEVHNRAADPAYQGAKADLRATLHQWMADHGDPFTTLQPTNRRGMPL